MEGVWTTQSNRLLRPCGCSTQPVFRGGFQQQHWEISPRVSKRVKIEAGNYLDVAQGQQDILDPEHERTGKRTLAGARRGSEWVG